jgi:hypothetical protein
MLSHIWIESIGVLYKATLTGPTVGAPYGDAYV